MILIGKTNTEIGDQALDLVLNVGKALLGRLVEYG